MKTLASMLRRSDVRKTLEIPQFTDEQRKEMNERAEQMKREDAARELAQRIERARIPGRYAAATLEDCHPAVAEYAREVERGGTGWLLLTGRNGRGKTHQACAVLRHLARTRRVEFAGMQEVLDECQHTFGRPESVREVEFHYRNVPMLVIDDFGKENPTDWSLPVVFSVIDGRYKHMRPTVITTNMSAEQMIEHMGRKGDRTMAASVVSRIAGARRVEIEGDDRRLQHGA